MPTTTASRTQLDQAIKQGAKTLEGSCSPQNLDVLEQLAAKIIQAFKQGNKVLLCGNGGSASQAQHIAAEFVGRFKRERKGLPSVSLTTDTSIITSLGNDYGYDTIFARQVESIGIKGDVLIALSTSGNSPNVVKAIEAATSQGISTAAFTGQGGGKLAGLASLVFRAPSEDTSHIQEAHITALHAVCDVVESAFCT